MTSYCPCWQASEILDVYSVQRELMYIKYKASLFMFFCQFALDHRNRNIKGNTYGQSCFQYPPHTHTQCVIALTLKILNVQFWMVFVVVLAWMLVLFVVKNTRISSPMCVKKEIVKYVWGNSTKLKKKSKNGNLFSQLNSFEM